MHLKQQGAHGLRRSAGALTLSTTDSRGNTYTHKETRQTEGCRPVIYHQLSFSRVKNSLRSAVSMFAQQTRIKRVKAGNVTALHGDTSELSVTRMSFGSRLPRDNCFAT